MRVVQRYLPYPTKRRSGEANLGITYIVCHDSGNSGSTAESNVDYYARTANDKEASAHAFVDDLGAVECVPLGEKAWHVRYDAGIAPNVEGSYANDHAIGVELCYSTFGTFDSTKAYSNYCEYIACLMGRYGLDESRLVQHAQLDPTRRTDPMNALSKIGVTWERFLSDVKKIRNPMDESKNDVAGDITKETPQQVKVTKVTVFSTKTVEGKDPVEESFDMEISDELVAMVQAAQSEGWNITVTK